MQGNDVQSNDVWRWRPDAVSSLDPRGGGSTLAAGRGPPSASSPAGESTRSADSLQL
jgi:hypothetical protein